MLYEGYIFIFLNKRCFIIEEHDTLMFLIGRNIPLHIHVYKIGKCSKCIQRMKELRDGAMNKGYVFFLTI